MAAFTRANGLDQALDILGSLSQLDTLPLSGEPAGLGQASGTTGSAGSITIGATNVLADVAITTSNVHPGQFITISGSPGNNGTFLVLTVATGSLEYAATGHVTDASGTIAFAARAPYSLQDDLNYGRADRKLIKGVTNWYDATPSITTADNQTVTANLTNLAAIATSAKNLIVSEMVLNQAVATSNTKITITFAAHTPSGGSADTWITTTTVKTGIPVFDGSGAYAADMESCYVIVTDPATGNEIRPVGSPDATIFGVTKKGAATTGNVEVAFYSILAGANLSTATPYTWQAGDPAAVNVAYPHSYRLDEVPANAFRRILTLGLVSDADLRHDINSLQTLTGISDEQVGIKTANITSGHATGNYPFANLTNLAGNGDTQMTALNVLNDAEKALIDAVGTTLGTTNISSSLTNATTYFPFYNGGTTPTTVIAALNALNSATGSLTFTGSILNGTPGTYTVTSALQALANALSASTVVRVIERLAADVNANTVHTVPAGIGTYPPDSTGNGLGLWVFLRGLLQDPGSVGAGDNYAEVEGTGSGHSATAFTGVKFFTKAKAGDHINYFKRG
jgi:hypothetical protein